MRNKEYDTVVEALRAGDPSRLDQLAREIDGFPHGVDLFIGRRWVINAVDVGCKAAVEWMLARGVELAFRDDEGYTPLHSALQRQGLDRYEIIEILLVAGAPVNLKGVNDWTPAHLAAALDDVEALRLLVAHGADLSIRTAIDDYATPLEEARNLGKWKAVEYLETREEEP